MSKLKEIKDSFNEKLKGFQDKIEALINGGADKDSEEVKNLQDELTKLKNEFEEAVKEDAGEKGNEGGQKGEGSEGNQGGEGSEGVENKVKNLETELANARKELLQAKGKKTLVKATTSDPAGEGKSNTKAGIYDSIAKELRDY